MSTQRDSRKRRRRPSNRFLRADRGVSEDNYQAGFEELQQDLVKLNTHGESTERKVELLSAIIVKQHKVISNLHDSVIELKRLSLSNELVILNLKESSPDNLRQSVIYAINSFGYTNKVDFEHIYRRGPPRNGPNATPRPVIVRMHRREAVDEILRAARPPPGTQTGKNALRIVPNLPEALRMQRAKLGKIAHNMYTRDNSAKIKVKKDYVEVNGTKISDDVDLATPGQVLFMDKSERANAQEKLFTTTNTIPCKGSLFTLYHSAVFDKSQCRSAHKAIGTMPEVAACTHLISAYTLKSGSIGWTDDDDHGLGRWLLKTMEERELYDSICFLTREYGGIHIGKKRYEIIEYLVNAIIVNIEAPADDRQAQFYKVKPPPMTLPHPSAQAAQWTTPRTYRKAARNPEQSGGDPKSTEDQSSCRSDRQGEGSI